MAYFTCTRCGTENYCPCPSCKDRGRGRVKAKRDPDNDDNEVCGWCGLSDWDEFEREMDSHGGDDGEVR